MFSRMFPRQFDNNYRGHRLALWLLVPVVLVKFAMGLNVSDLNPWISNVFVLETADRIPLGSYSADAAKTVVFLFASWGLALLILSTIGLVALIRYRAMIPLIYLALTAEQAGRMLLHLAHPVVKAATGEGVSGGALINYGLTAALVIGLVFSLMGKRYETA